MAGRSEENMISPVGTGVLFAGFGVEDRYSCLLQELTWVLQ